MPKKLFSFLILFSLLFSVPVSAASSNEYEATVNVNVRDNAGIHGKRIGYFKKGEKVQVINVFKNWCQVKYRNYRNAYVYCPNLKPTGNFQNSNMQWQNIDEYVFAYPNNMYFNFYSIDYFEHQPTVFELVNLIVYPKKDDRKTEVSHGWEKLKTETLHSEHFNFVLDFYKYTNEQKMDIYRMIATVFDEEKEMDFRFGYIYSRALGWDLIPAFKEVLMSLKPYENSQKSQLDYKSYTSKYWYSLEYPADWKVEETETSVRFFKDENLEFVIEHGYHKPFPQTSHIKKVKTRSGIYFDLSYAQQPSVANGYKGVMYAEDAWAVDPKGDHDAGYPDYVRGKFMRFTYNSSIYPDAEKTLIYMLESIQTENIDWDMFIDEKENIYITASSADWYMGNYNDKVPFYDYNLPYIMYYLPEDIRAFNLEGWEKIKNETVVSKEFTFILNFYKYAGNEEKYSNLWRIIATPYENEEKREFQFSFIYSEDSLKDLMEFKRYLSSFEFERKVKRLE